MLSFWKNKIISLRICRHRAFHEQSYGKRVLLSAIWKTGGSLTIEAALVLTLFLFAMLTLLSLSSLLLFTIRTQEALHQQAKYLAQQAYIEWEFDEKAVQYAVLEQIGPPPYWRRHRLIMGQQDLIFQKQTCRTENLLSLRLAMRQRFRMICSAYCVIDLLKAVLCTHGLDMKRGLMEENMAFWRNMFILQKTVRSITATVNAVT